MSRMLLVCLASLSTVLALNPTLLAACGGGSSCGGGSCSGGGHASHGGGGSSVNWMAVAGRSRVDPMYGLVDVADGSVLESMVDFALPAKGSPEVQWRCERTYDSLMPSGVHDTAQGFKWFHRYLQNLTPADPNNPTTTDVTWRVDAHRTHTFEATAAYTYDPSDTTFATLTHDGGSHWVLQHLDGTLLRFNDWTASSNERGKLTSIEDLYGNTLTVTYQGSNTGRIDKISDASGHSIQYNYHTSGDNSGRLSTIEVYKDSSQTSADLIAKIEFTHKATSDGNDADCGIIGDLIKVVAKTHKTGETGTTWSIARTTHYRYYSGAYDVSSNPGTDHLLKYVLHPEHFKRASDDPGFGDPLTADDTDVDDYTTYQLEYDSNYWAREQVMSSGAGSCGSCGGASHGTFTFAYSTQSNTDRNDWVTHATIEHKVSSTAMWTAYVDSNHKKEEFQRALFVNTTFVHGEEFTRDSSGRVTTYAAPSAISDYNTSTKAFTYVSTGQMFDFAYASSAKLLESVRLYKYSETGSADGRYLAFNDYTAAPSGVAYRTARYLLSASYVYPTETTTYNHASRLATSYEYVCHPDTGDLDGDTNTTEQTDRPMVVKVTYPTVTTGQNGPNVAGSTFQYIDTAGRVRWIKDAEGYVHYRSYNDLTGAMTYSVQDVYTGASEGAIDPAGITSPDTDGGVDVWADWTGAAPKDTGSPAYSFQVTPTSYRALASKSLLDLQGRTRSMTDPNGTVTWLAYLDAETRTYSAWNATTDKPLLPARRMLSDQEGRTTQAVEVDPTNVTFSDPPTGAEDLSDQDKWVSWSKTSYDSSLRPSTRLAYHLIPSSGDGSAGTNYYTTTYTYGEDTTARLEYTQVEDPESGYTKTWTDARGLRTKIEGTATESSGSPTSWKTFTEFCYDQATPGSGNTSYGEGRLTQLKQYYDDSNSNSTSFTYDWRGRQVFNGPPAGPKTLNLYDNMDRVVATGQYSNGTSLAVGDNPTSEATGRLALRETKYNDRGQAYLTTHWEINQSTGATDSYLVTSMYYDRNGRLVASGTPGGGIQVTQYNGAGQVVQTQSCTSLGSSIYDGLTSAFDYSLTDNKVVEATVTWYYLARPAVITRYELLSTASASIGSAYSDALPTYSRIYYDAMGRRTQTTDLGSNNGTLDGGMKDGSPPFGASGYSPGSPESRGDYALVTT